MYASLCLKSHREQKSTLLSLWHVSPSMQTRRLIAGYLSLGLRSQCFPTLQLKKSSPEHRLSLQPWVFRCARGSRHLHGWAHGFGYCLHWPIRDKPPENCGAECGHNLAAFRAIFDNYPRWWTPRGLTVIFRMLAHTLFTSFLLIISRNNSVLLWICNDVTGMPSNPCAQPWRWRESQAHRDTHGWKLSLPRTGIESPFCCTIATRALTARWPLERRGSVICSCSASPC